MAEKAKKVEAEATAEAQKVETPKVETPAPKQKLQ